MKIIIAGGGAVGFHLAKLLSYEAQDITLIDPSKSSLKYADNNLDILTIRGSATSIDTLKEAGVKSAELVIAVTSSESTNITICVLAKKLGAKKCIARISNNQYIFNNKDIVFQEIGIDELISPNLLAVMEIEHLVNQMAFNDMYEFEGGLLSMVGILLPENSVFVGKTVMEVAKIKSNIDFMPISIQRKGETDTIIPRGDTVLRAYDQVYFLTTQEGVEQLQDLAYKKKRKLNNIIVLGGSPIGIDVASRLSEKGFDVKLFEIDREKAYEVSDLLSNVIVINGDGRDAALLEEENIKNTDVFIAVTDDSETNVMSCMMAKNHKAQKAIALSDNIEYYRLMQTMGIDTIINKKVLAANSIFKYIRKGSVVEMMNLSNSRCEIIEFIVSDKCLVVGKEIKDLNLPKSVVIGGVIRDGKGYIPLGGFKIEQGDRIIVCSLPEAIKKVEKMFI